MADEQKHELTRAEVQTWLAAAGLEEAYSQPEQVAAVLDYLNGVYSRERIALEAKLYEQIRAGLTGTPSEEALKAARRRAVSQADDLARNLTQTALRQVGDTIADGVAAGLSPIDTARMLDMVKGLDGPRAARYLKYLEYLEQSDMTDDQAEKAAERFYGKLLKERRETIARTEQRHATAAARELEAQERGAKYKIWMTVGDARVSDVCMSCESAGWIPAKHTFPGGFSRPPAHPNCRCTLAYRTFPPDSRARERAERRAAATEDARAQAESATE